jgi:hypothetical protein
MLYLGVVVDVELDSAFCLIRFGDCTEKWSHFGDLRRLGDEDSNSEPEVPAIKTPIPPPPAPKPVVSPLRQCFGLGPILQNSISAGNFSDYFSASNFRQSSTQKNR